MIKTRSLPLSRGVEARPSRLVEALAPATSDEALGRALKHWAAAAKYLLVIEAKPLQSEHSNQNHCLADGYISIRTRFPANAILSTEGCESRSNAAAGRRVAGLDCLQHRSDSMVKCTTLVTSAGNLIGDKNNSITPAAHGGSTLEKVIKPTGKIATAFAVAFFAFALTATPGSAQNVPPAIIPPGHYCVSYDGGGSDCSFKSYAQCEATASGQDAECYGNTPADDEDHWDTRASRGQGRLRQ
jgi:hypothetical protein